ncbi:MAG: agmatinase [Dehalococcoidia bacterium]|nr:agmatinase [Dehalococcoidia bacterium]MDD5493632.1 agmatinase [Dehalococcoidia bacterium]
MFSPSWSFAGLTPPHSDLVSSKVVILPVPYDGTTEWHSGTREGPRSIIEASVYLEWYDIELEREIYEIGIHTLPELQPSINCASDTIERVYKATKDLLEKAKFVVTLGGEHSITAGTVRAFSETYSNFCVLQLDAHTDLRDQYQGSKFSHACVMRRVIDMCPIVQAGVRSMSLEEKQFIASRGLQPFLLSDSSPHSVPVKEIVNSLSDNVYISIDMDVFDPSIMPAVGTPEPGGLFWDELLNLLKSVSQNKNIVGFDIVELCPNQGPASCPFTAAKLAYKLIGYSFYNK